MSSSEQEVVDATNALLGAIGRGDIAGYERLSDKGLTCFEPETQGHLIEGLAFHRHMLNLGRGGSTAAVLNTICAPSVRMLGPDHAMIAYVRIVQNGDKITQAQETRLWQRGRDGQWRNLHFHKSKL